MLDTSKISDKRYLDNLDNGYFQIPIKERLSTRYIIEKYQAMPKFENNIVFIWDDDLLYIAEQGYYANKYLKEEEFKKFYNHLKNEDSHEDDYNELLSFLESFTNFLN